MDIMEPTSSEFLEDSGLINSATSSRTSTDYNAVLFGEKSGKFSKTTMFGKVRNFRRFSWLEWVFLIISTISMLGVLGLTIERLLYFHNENNTTVATNNSLPHCHVWYCTKDFIFSILFLVNLLFCALYCYDGILRENEFEIITYICATVMLSLYIIINYSLGSEVYDSVKIARLVLVCVLGPVNILLAGVVVWRMGYLAFSVVGSNTELLGAYRIRSLFISVLICNIQLAASVMTVTFVRHLTFIGMAEKVLLPLLLLYTVLLVFVAWVALIYELHWLMVAFHIGTPPIYTYYIYKISNVVMNYNLYHNVDPGGSKYTAVAIVLFVECGLGIVVLLVTSTLAAFAQMNFGKGLKQKIKPHWCRSSRYSDLQRRVSSC